MIQVINLKTMREDAPPSFSVLCLGNFDGVHLGHRALAMETLRQKEALASSYVGIASGAWLFDTPPSHFLSCKPVPQLTTLEEKLEHFARIGLDYAFLADFSELKGLESTEFVERVLKKECHCVYTVCGYNFRFAKNAMGDAEALVDLMGGMGRVLDCVTLDGKAISSSAIRAQLASGNAEEASRMLGYPFALSSTVLHGKALGKKIGVPTINQHFSCGAMRLMDGVYISRTQIDGKSFPSVSNIGHRPTFDDGDAVNCETHIIGYEGDLYDRPLRVEFFKRLRSEVRFPSVEALGEQLKADISAAKQYFEDQRRQI